MKGKFSAVDFFTKHLLNVKKKLTGETTFGNLEVISSVRPRPLRQIELTSNIVNFCRERDNRNRRKKCQTK
jgi:hypothetical protein|tara:strand:- start:255 stop:467 length:213 start_codon:yes stop_codon:yes gene_type:complete